MKRIATVLVLLSISYSLHAQYYYNEIVAAEQSHKQYLSFKKNQVKEVTASSFESDGKQAEGFEVNQKISADYQKIITKASYPSVGPSYTTHLYKGSRLYQTTDSTDRVITQSVFEYDAQGSASRITSTTKDGFMKSTQQELHLWSYKEDGTPGGMLKIKDGKDTTSITFLYDEQGNISEEHWVRKGYTSETWYYYYNDKKQLTDIVRFNARAKRLLPDYLFEYDENGRVAQMTQVLNGGANYMIWKYLYHPSGLKLRDVCMNKQKTIVGRIEYTYTNW